MSAPVIYYLAVFQQSFGSLSALCRRLGVAEEELELYQKNASFHNSDLVVVDKLRLGDPELNVCAGLKFGNGGSVKLLACFFGEASSDRAEVESFAREMAQDKEFAKREMFVGVFHPAFSRGLPQ